MKMYGWVIILAILWGSCGSKSDNVDVEKKCQDLETVAEIDRFHANIYSENGKVYFKSTTNTSLIYEACDVLPDRANGAQTEVMVSGLLKARTSGNTYQKIAVISISWITKP